MKRGTLSFLSLLILVLTLEAVSACIINNNDQVGIVFPNGYGIDMAALERYCSEKSCVTISNNVGALEYKEINFKAVYAKHEILMVARRSKEGNKSEIYSLSLKFMDKYPESEELTSLALKLLATNNIVYGFSLEDIKKISCPILFIHGEKDDKVSVSEMWAFYHVKRRGREMDIEKGAGHDLKPKRKSVYLLVEDWFNKYLKR